MLQINQDHNQEFEGYIEQLRSELARTQTALAHEQAARRQAEEALFLAERRLYGLFEQLPFEDTALQTPIASEQQIAVVQQGEAQARISAAGRAVLQRLADKPDLDTFLGHVLTVAAEQFRACGASLWLYDQPSDRVELLLVYTAPDANQTSAATIVKKSGVRWHIDVSGLRRGQITAHRAPQFEGVIEEFKPGLKAAGVISALCIPMFLGEGLQGLITLVFNEDRYLMSEEEQLAEMLANYAVLALELTQLAHEARQAAVLYEQEQAAQERAAQLKKANDVLKISLDTLATKPDLDSFLGQVLSTVTQHLGVNSSMLWLTAANTTFGKAYLQYESGVVVRHDENITVSNSTQKGSYRLLSNLVLIPDLDTADEGDLTRDQIAGIRATGVKTWASIPLWLGDQLIGAVTIRSTTPCHITREQIELVQTLVKQATLALELNRLAEKAKQTAQEAAVLEERTRFARDIHDTLAQGFTGVRMQLEAADFLLESQPATARACIGRALSLAQEGLIQARQSVMSLRGDAEKYPDLPTALRETVQQMTQATGVEVETIVQGIPYELAAEVNLGLLRITQEAITNVLRHAQATCFKVCMTFLEQEICIVVTDDGRGFNVEASQEGFGLRGMWERAHQLGAKLSIVSQVGQGTEITIILPVGQTV